MGLINTSDFGERLAPGIRAFFGVEYPKFPQLLETLFDVRGSKKAFEEVASESGFGNIPVKPQGQSVSFSEPKQDFKDRVVHITYGLGFKITLEMIEDEIYGNFVRMWTRDLAMSAANTKETIAANMLNNGFSANFTFADGVAMMSTAHPLGQGGTSRNELSTAADLSTASLEQAEIDITDFKKGSGLPVRALTKRLILPPALKWTGSKILDSTLEPESANNAVNPAHKMMPFVVWQYLTNPKAWFIQTTIPNALVFYNRRAVNITLDNDNDSDNAKFKITFRVSSTSEDWRGIFGSPGGGN